MECKGPQGILRILFTQYGGEPKSHTINYYFSSNLSSFEMQSSIEKQYGVTISALTPAGPIIVYRWDLDPRRGVADGIAVFLAAPKSGSEYVLRLTDNDLMMKDYELRPKAAGPKF
jgi:hypothetical protein